MSTKIIFQRMLGSCFFFLPGIFFTWLLIENSGCHIDGYAVYVARAGFFALTCSLYEAAARKSAGKIEKNVIWFALERNSSPINLILILSFIILLTVFFAAISFFLGLNPDRPWVWGASGILCLAIILWFIGRFWPTVIIPFHYGGHLSWSGAAHGLVWVGEGFRKAWQLTGQRGAWQRTTLPLMLWGFGISVIYLLLRWLTIDLPLPRFLLNLAFYACAMPFLSIMADGGAELLIKENEA